MEDELSDEDVGLLSDDEVGLDDQTPAPVQASGDAASPDAELSDEDVGLLSDADVGIEEEHHETDPNRLTAGVREFGHAIGPAVGGMVAAGQGARLGAMLGLPLAPYTAGWSVPVGGALGAIGGFAGGGLALSAIQEKAFKLFGWDDSATRHANAEEYPMSTWVGGTAAGLAGMAPGVALAVWQRLISAGALTALEGTMQYMTEGHLDPKKLAAAAAAGAIFYTPNRVGQKLLDTGEKVANKMFPGAAARLDAATAPAATQTPPTGAPEAAQSHVDVGDTAHAPEAAEQGDLFAGKQATIGNPQSAPTRDGGSDGRYKKGAENTVPGANAPSEGEIAPDTQAALEEWLNQGDAPKPPTPLTAADSGMLNPGEDLPIKAGFPETPEERLEKKHPHVEDVVEAAKQPGIQQPVEAPEVHPQIHPAGVNPILAEKHGYTTEAPKFEELKPGDTRADSPPGKGPTEEQHADLMGAPEADKYPPGAGDKALKAIEDEIAKLEAKQNIKKGEMARLTSLHGDLRAVHAARERINGIVENNEKYGPPTREIKGEPHVAPSDAQVKANNYKKARSRFAGKETAIETAAGGIRRSKNPKEPWEVEMPYHYGDVKGVKGADGDDLDIGFGKGKKHFIIDQRDTKTGKFDEHKVMADFNSEADALTNYRRGFSDGKGRDRMMHITEVTEKEAGDWFNNGDKSVPFRQAGRGTPGRPLKSNTPGLVTAAVSELRKRGMETAAKAIEALPPKEQLVAAAQADASFKNRTGKIPDAATAERQATKRQGVRTPAPVVEGTNVSANTKPEAIRKANTLKAAEKIFEEYKVDPKRNSPETDAETIARAKAAAQASRTIGTYPFRMTKKTDAVSWLKAARELGAKPNEEKLLKFRTDEVLARNKSGNLVQETSGIKAGIELNRNAGDERIAAAEAEHAKNEPWDIPHEEAERDVVPKVITNEKDLEATTLPRKTLDRTKPDYWDGLTERTFDRTRTPKKDRVIDATKAEGRKELAKQLAGKKPEAAIEVPERFITMKDGTKVKADKPESEVRKVTVSDELKRQYAEKLNAPKELKSGTSIDMYAKFLKDDSAAVDIQQIGRDLRRAYNATTSYFAHPIAKSYRARKPQNQAEEYAASIDEEFQKLKQEDIDHKGRMMKWADNLPAPLHDLPTLERIYFAREEGKIANLSAADKALYDQHLKPMLDENDAVFKNLKDNFPERVGREVQDHMYRIIKGSDAEHNMLFERGESSDPIEGINAIGTRPKGPALDRPFAAMERADGKRFVIHINDDGFTFWKNGSGRKVVDPSFKFKSGEDYQVGSQTFKMGEATTREIEANARIGDKNKKVEYYHNAAMSAGMTNVHLGSMLRHLEYLNSLKDEGSPLMRWAAKPGQKAKDGWITTALTNFKDWKMDPRLAWVMDDYAQPGFNESSLNWLRRLSQAVTKTIFWLPTAHINNVGTHWFVGRGWDWLTPPGYRSLVMNSTKAIKSVITQDPFQSEIRLAGAGTIYGGTITEDFTRKFGQKLGEHIKSNPAKWDPIARVFGWGPSTLAKAIYNASKHIMWSVNDMFLTQSIMEKMDLHGMTLEQAIKSSERHIPNYRVPATVVAGSNKIGRAMSQVVQDSLGFVFGRYHYGMINSYANMVNDMVRGTPAERFHAIGNLMALGALSMLVYPALDAGWQKLTGDKHASAQRRGPLAIPHHVGRALEGKADPLQAARSTLTVSPLASTVMETLNNKDFRGKPIASPGDFRLAGHGSWKAGARVAIGETEHLARGLISPLGTVEQGWNKKQGPLETLRDQALDIRNPSPKQAMREAQAPRLSLRESLQRYRHPPGIGEEYFNKKFGH